MIASTPTSADNEFLEDYREGLRSSIEYFSAENKPQRECWVCHEFLRNLGVRYRRSEVVPSSEEPPDVVFRSARFEVKEVLDTGRRRHAEYKASYKRSLAATTVDDLVTLFDPVDLTAADVLEKVIGVLDCYSDHYSAQVRGSLDLLVYVNLSRHFFKKSSMPVSSAPSRYGWRSVSAITGWQAMVFHAEKGAPRVLSLRRGSLTPRRNRE